MPGSTPCRPRVWAAEPWWNSSLTWRSTTVRLPGRWRLSPNLVTIGLWCSARTGQWPVDGRRHLRCCLKRGSSSTNALRMGSWLRSVCTTTSSHRRSDCRDRRNPRQVCFERLPPSSLASPGSLGCAESKVISSFNQGSNGNEANSDRISVMSCALHRPNALPSVDRRHRRTRCPSSAKVRALTASCAVAASTAGRGMSSGTLEREPGQKLAAPIVRRRRRQDSAHLQADHSGAIGAARPDRSARPAAASKRGPARVERRRRRRTSRASAIPRA